MNIAIVKYNAGNICSVVNAVRRLGVEPVVTDDPQMIRAADGVLFPGQGEARYTMQYLRETGLDKVILSLKQPVLGICIGMQLLCEHSEEGDTPCLGEFPCSVKRFVAKRHEDKIPHMGWNSLENPRGELFDGVKDGDYVYFIHSYYVEKSPYSIAECDYINTFSAAIHKDNFWATQFHPEKSGQVGEKILQNFLNICNHH